MSSRVLFPKVRATRGHPEADLQRAVVPALRLILAPPARVAGIQNEVRLGGKDGHVAQAINEGMGVLPGFSDVVIMQDGKVGFMELKSGTGRLSEDQLAFRTFVREQGHHWALVRSLDDALAAITLWGFRTRIAAP
jgi:hypothetical protein